MMISIPKIIRRAEILSLVFVIIFLNKTYGQAGLDLPILEDFESDSAWVWKPWENTSNGTSVKSKGSAHSGSYGIFFNKNIAYLKRYDIQIGFPGQTISCWFRFHAKTNAYLGFGENSIGMGHGYYLVLAPERNSFDFRKSADYTYPNLKTNSQTYQLNVWYRAEVVFNTTTNVTGNLYAANGKTLLNSITVEIPELTPGGIAFKGHSVSADDIRGGSKQEVTDTSFAPKLGKPLVLKNIVFELNKSNLLEQSYVELNKLVMYLKRNPTLKISIVGYTDNIGKEEDNINLSKARAKAVADYLIKNNINKNNINYNGLGSSNPIAVNTTEVGRQKNRRVELVINK
jgi:outer membrane protein OmpA-like peptidoglycan-associated protein